MRSNIREVATHGIAYHLVKLHQIIRFSEDRLPKRTRYVTAFSSLFYRGSIVGPGLDAGSREVNALAVKDWSSLPAITTPTPGPRALKRLAGFRHQPDEKGEAGEMFGPPPTE